MGFPGSSVCRRCCCGRAGRVLAFRARGLVRRSFSGGGTRAPLMGTIVKGQSRAILPLRFPRYLGSSVHRRLSADAIRLQKVSSVFLLFAIRSLRRACIVWSVFRGAIYRAHFHAGARAHSPGTGHRDFVKPGARANERAQLRLARNPLDWLRCRLLLP